MATLRYINNSRTGEPGTLVELDTPLQFYDDDSYIVATAAGALKIVGGTSLTIEATTLTLTGAFTFTGALALSDTLTITKSSAATTGTIRSLAISQTMTTASTGNIVEGINSTVTANVKTGQWANAIVGKIDYSTSGAAHGLAAAICAEMIPPNSSLTRGALYALDLEFGCQASSAWGSAGPVAFMKMENYGTATYFSANAFMFYLKGETSATGNLVYNNTIKCKVGSTTWYLPLSSAEGTFTTAYPIVTSYATTAITVGACVTGIQLTNVSGYALQVITDGRVLLGTTDVGLPLAAGEHGLAVHCEPAVMTDYTSSFGVRSRYHISNAQTKVVTAEAVDARMRVKAALTQGIYAGVQGYVEVSESPTLAATQIHAGGFTVEVGAGTTLSSGYVCGVHIDSATADSVSVAGVTYAALRISTGTSSKEIWTYGMFMADNDVVTGIQMGICTTGIKMTGVTGYAIQVVTDGRAIFGTTDVGLPLADSEHGLAVHCEPSAAFTAYTSSFGIRSRYHISVAQTNIVTFEAVDARLRVKHNMAGGVHAGVQGYIEISDSPTLTTGINQAGGFTVEAGAGTTLTSGYLYGVHIDSATADTVDVSNVTYSALRISTGTSSKEMWTYGIYMGDDDAVTGMQIGDCTTGIKLDGTFTSAINIAATIGNTATTVQTITVTDSGTLNAGRNIGLFVDYVMSGTKTGSFGVRSTRINTQVLADVPSVQVGDWYMHSIADKTIGWLQGLAIYWEDYGDSVEQLAMIDLGINSPHATGDRHCFIRFREHDTVQSASSILRLEGGNAAHYLIEFNSSPGAMDAGVILEGNSDTETSDYRVIVKTTVGDRYIYLYPV